MRRDWIVLGGFLFLLGGCATMTFVPAPPPADYPMIDDCQYASDSAAAAAWQPAEKSTPPAGVAVLGGRKVLRLPCTFSTTSQGRTAWDRAVQINLAACQGIKLQLFCLDPSVLSGIMVYFLSGNGWYSAQVFPKEHGRWNTITIDKAKTHHEGTPAGWGKIQTIRIAAYPGRSRDTEIYVSDIGKMGVLGADALVAIVRAESAATVAPSEAIGADQFARTVAQCLEALGIGYAIISDLDVTAERLKDARIAILPHNPGMPETVADELVKYVNAGGKVLIFYGVPRKLRPLLKIEGGAHIVAKYPGYFSTIRFADKALPGAPPIVGQRSWNISEAKPITGSSRTLAEWFDLNGKPTGLAAVVASDTGMVMTHVLLSDDSLNKQRMLLAMLGHFVPELWRKAAEDAVLRIGKVAEHGNLDDAFKGILRESKNNPKVREMLLQARRLRDEAIHLGAEDHFPEAMERALKAQDLMIRAYCAAQQPLEGETRLFWCHSAFGVEGMTWDEAIKNLADNGFTGILPNMLWGGAAFYPSKVLPVAPQVAEKGDQIAKCVAACKKYGVQIHVWKVNWYIGGQAPKEFVEKMRREGRLQVDVKGKESGEDGAWLCPSHPENQKLEIDSMVEVARNYDVDGLHFDYIRYPGPSYCFCPGCRERFQKACGVAIKEWPKDVLGDGPLRQQWLDWRRSNITTVVKAVSEQARLLKPGIKISAAVFRTWPTDRDSVGQDWSLWCEKGYLDFVCPMDYTENDQTFENWVVNQKVWAKGTPVYPGIGAHSSSSHLAPEHVIAQIKITRKHNTRGFTIFNYGPGEAKDLAPLLGMGITSRR